MDAHRGTGAVLTGTIRTVAETGSTNADLLAAARAGAAGEGDWLRAEVQTAGRGRHGRAWSSPAGNLYASTLIRVRPGDPSAASLALVAAVALHRAVRGFGNAGVRIKWPNDLMAHGAKLAGLLLEREGEWIVAGFGTNIASAPELADRETTSLARLMTQPPAPAALLAALADELAAAVARWRSAGLPAMTREWAERAHPVGTALAVALPGGEMVRGGFDGLDETGALRLRLADGERRVIHAGDVILI